MALEVIGAGIGRTGTESLKLALELLGFGKCYHMVELIRNPSGITEWEKLEAGDRADFDKLFNGYASCVDFPGAPFFKQLMAAYPDAKVILTLRDPDKWYASASRTIFRTPPPAMLGVVRFLGLFSKRLQLFPRVIGLVKRVGIEGIFQNQTRDPENTKRVFNEWNEEVKRTVPYDKLLVFRVADGWEPLCSFLGVTVPETPFPHSNQGAAFRRRNKRFMFTGKV